MRSEAVQIVGYDRTPDAAIHVADNGVLTRVPIGPGERLAYGLGKRECAGTIVDGEHRPCDRPDVPWCADHSETWICARCRGTCLKDVMDCHVSHVVYLALVAPDAAKVGVTKAERFETRMHEQGADRGAIIHEVENGRIAREIETEIARQMPDRIPIGRKINGLSHAVDESVWADTLEPYEPARTHEPAYDFSIDTQPIPETLATGVVRGAKGRLVVLDKGESTYVTDLRELVGYHVSPGAEERNLQSGLNAFG